MIAIDKWCNYLQMEKYINYKTGLLKTGFFRLEFSEKQQHFHLNRGTHAQNTHGWRTVCQSGDDAYLSAFIDYMISKYNLNTKWAKKVKLSTVMTDWHEYKVIIEMYEKRKSIHEKISSNKI